MYFRTLLIIILLRGLKSTHIFSIKYQSGRSVLQKRRGKQLAKLTIEQVINNNEIFTTKQQNTFLNQLTKNGRLQSKSKERIKNEYLRFYHEVNWEGKGKQLCLEINSERDIIHRKINGHTKERSILGALLIILYSYLNYLKYGEELEIKMNRAKWMQLTGIKTTINDSYNYKERYSQLLYDILVNQMGNENKDIINYATGNYEKARVAFNRSIWNSVINFLSSSYKVIPQVITLYDFNEDAILNKYAERLEKYINKKQNKLKSKQIIKKMVVNWEKYNDQLVIPQEKPKNVQELILRSENVKKCILKTVSFDYTKVGIERIHFDFSTLPAGDYEKYNKGVMTDNIEKKFNKRFKGIEATNEEKDIINSELSIYMQQNDFNLGMLFYSPYSEKSLGYQVIEKNTLNELGYEKRYSLININYDILKNFIEKPFFIHNSTTEKLSNNEVTIAAMMTGRQRVIQPLIFEAWKEKLLNHAKNNKSLPGMIKQSVVHPVINDVLYILMRMTDNFYESQHLPKNKLMKYQLKRADKEKYMGEIDVMDEEIKAVLDRYRYNNSLFQFEISEEEMYLQKAQIEDCYNIINKLIDGYECS